MLDGELIPESARQGSDKKAGKVESARRTRVAREDACVRLKCCSAMEGIVVQEEDFEHPAGWKRDGDGLLPTSHVSQATSCKLFRTKHRPKLVCCSKLRQAAPGLSDYDALSIAPGSLTRSVSIPRIEIPWSERWTRVFAFCSWLFFFVVDRPLSISQYLVGY
jgi:hypothetical protein